jgi:poly(3-hydroxybutyrate) depolymerase
MRLLTLIALTCISTPACSDESAAPLPGVNAAATVTVSGLSSGAYMAGQYHVAFSASVAGAALVAGGPWGCARGDISRALGLCIHGQGLDVGELAELAQASAAAAAIDPLTGLKDDRVFVFRGSRDELVAKALSAAAVSWYRSLAPDVAVTEVYDIPVAHGWPTIENGQPCAEFGAPFIYACDYDLAGTLLAHLLGELAPPADTHQALRAFSQREFGGEGLADNGLVYIPQACQQESACRVHVFFHGCGQAYGQIGSLLAESAGFLPIAESNRLIVLFPQVAASRVAPVNPLACWDWWGYSGENYLGQSASQLRAIRAMVSRLQGAG